MADSPWNAKSGAAKISQLSAPQNELIQDLQRKPPETSIAPAQEQASGLQADSPPPVRKQRASKKKKRPFPVLAAIALSLLALILIAAFFSRAYETRRLNTLVEQRETEALRIKDHRDEHLFARKRSGYSDLIEKYAKEYGISPSFISAIIKCESSYKPNVSSKVDARGLMQIMPNTGVWLAGKLDIADYSPERLFEPELNIRFGAYFLAYLSDQFKGSPVMVAAAYHAGADNVKLWALRDAADQKTITLDQIPNDDTRGYVRKVMDAYAIYFQEDQAIKNGAVPAFMLSAALNGDGTGNAGR